VQEDGQIQELDEAEAGFRLASIATAPSPSERDLPGAALPSATRAKPKRTGGRPPGGRPSAPAAAIAQPVAPTPWRMLVAFHRWMWAIGTIIVLIVLLRMYG
jgi:hypothetical protein